MFILERKNKKSISRIKGGSVAAGSLFVINACFCGGYYEFVEALLGALLAFLLIVLWGKESRTGKWDSYLVFPLLLVLAYALSAFYAVDSGMAWIGVVKKCVPFLFACTLFLLTEEQRYKILQMLPEYAVFISVIAGIGGWIPSVRPYVVKAGRFAGTFGYANTYALFVLLGLLVLLEREKKQKRGYTVVLGSILLVGLWLSGSRYTWILAIGIFIFLAIRQKKYRKQMSFLLGILLVATVGAATAFRHTETIGRLFTTNKSTLYGRLLYWQDAWKLIRTHPFGMGYLGYYYEQTRIQTGVYTVRYVHNDWLQLVLDVGWIPAVLLLGILFRAFWNHKRSFLEKLLLGVIAIHACMEFDLEHNTIMMLLVLILSCREETFFNKWEWKISPAWCKSLLLLVGGICLYYFIPLTLYAVGDTQRAAVCYPVYTEAQIVNLSLEEDPDEAEALADQIIRQNATVALAYDAKAQVAFLQGDADSMFQYKKEAIRRNKFDVNEYTDALLMLRAMEEESEQKKIKQGIKEIKKLAEKNKAEVSVLGKRIDDQVNLELPEELLD